MLNILENKIIKPNFSTKINFRGLDQNSLKTNNSYLLAFDLDGTFCHGTQDEVKQLLKLADRKDHKLMYVTGRPFKEFERIRQNLIKQDINLPIPDYYISNNGQFIYENKLGKMSLREDWNDIITRSGFDREKIKQTLEDFNKDISKNNDPAIIQFDYVPSAFNIEYLINSRYYTPDLESNTAKYLQSKGVKGRVIFDYVPPEDIRQTLPRLDTETRKRVENILDKDGGLNIFYVVAANKADAVEFMRTKLDINKDHVITAGNAGNDISMTDKGYWFIMVKNAERILREYIDKLAPELRDRIIKATKEGTSGIIEGVDKVYSIIGFR